MEIAIITDELIRSVSDAYLQEVVSIDDKLESARPSGPVTETEYERAISTADATLRLSIMRFIKHERPGYADNTHGMTDEFVYEFIGSPRRLGGKATTLADLIHDALKELSLSELFKLLSKEMSDTHKLNGEARLEQIDTLLLLKNPPIVKYSR